MSRFLGQVIIASIEYMDLPILHGLTGPIKNGLLDQERAYKITPT